MRKEIVNYIKLRFYFAKFVKLHIKNFKYQKNIFKKGDRGYHLEINSGTVEVKNNKVTALVE